MTKDDFAKVMEEVFEGCRELRGAGQAEYAGGSDAFGNFNRLSGELCISRESVLWVYAMKHRDGIVSFLNGHRSQREDVRGRIKDLIVYLTLLYGMIEENDSKIVKTNPIRAVPAKLIWTPSVDGKTCIKCGMPFTDHVRNTILETYECR